jgi:hypothetical protein
MLSTLPEPRQPAVVEELHFQKRPFSLVTPRGSRDIGGPFFFLSASLLFERWSRSLFFQSRGIKIKGFPTYPVACAPGHTTSVLNQNPGSQKYRYDTLPADEAKAKPLLSLKQVLASI